MLHVRQAAAAAIHGDAAAEHAGDGFANLGALARDNRDRGEFLDAMDDEVEGPRRREIGEDGIERGFDAEHRHRHDEEDDVESENHIAYAEERAALADQQRGDLRAIEDRAAANRESDASAEKKSAENRVQQTILGDCWVLDERNRRRASAPIATELRTANAPPS